MIDSKVGQRVQLLLNSGRYTEAINYLEAHLSDYPQDNFAQYCLALAHLRTGDNDKSRQICEQLLIENPDSEHVISLSAEIDIEEERYIKAESKAEILISINPYDSDHHLLMGRIKLAQRNYDKSLVSLNKSLEIDPENLDALNTKIVVDSLLGNKSTDGSVEQALELDPESAYTIANQANQMLRKGNVQGALDRLHYALSLDPSNQLAQSVMQQAIKSKFWPYRMFAKYGEYMARLSAGSLWKIILGLYIGNQVMLKIAESNESLGKVLYPVVYFIIALFLLSWVLDPLMNLYLLTNKYGRALLNKDDKIMAICTGLALALSIIFCIFYFITDHDKYLWLFIPLGLLLIPLGSFLNPKTEKYRLILKIYVLALIVIFLTAYFTINNSLTYVYMFGIFAYQWIVNGMLIKENSRVF